MSQASPITLTALGKVQGLQKQLLASLDKTSAGLGHFLKVLAQSPSAHKAYAELQTLNHNGKLDRLTGLRIALTLAALNQCQHSLSLHTLSAREAGLNSSEIDSNRQGTSQDAKGAVAVQFVRNLANLSSNHQALSSQQWHNIRNAGYSDPEILEIISHVAMNLLGNMLTTAKEVESNFAPLNLNTLDEKSELSEAPTSL